MALHPSDSAVQRGVEKVILADISATVGVAVAAKRLELAEGTYVDVDGVAEDLSIFVEVFAR